MAPDKFQAWYDGKLAEAAATPAPPPSGQAAGPVLNLAAQNIKFDQAELTAPANAPFTIHFENKDQGVPHDVDVLDANGQKVEDGKDFPGPGAQDYAEKPLPAGTYKFECSIHPQAMFGTLTVK